MVRTKTNTLREMTSEITGVSTVFPTICSANNKRKYKSFIIPVLWRECTASSWFPSQIVLKVVRIHQHVKFQAIPKNAEKIPNVIHCIKLGLRKIRKIDRPWPKSNRSYSCMIMIHRHAKFQVIPPMRSQDNARKHLLHGWANGQMAGQSVGRSFGWWISYIQTNGPKIGGKHRNVVPHPHPASPPTLHESWYVKFLYPDNDPKYAHNFTSCSFIMSDVSWKFCQFRILFAILSQTDRQTNWPRDRQTDEQTDVCCGKRNIRHWRSYTLT